MVIDPGDDADLIIQTIQKENLTLDKITATHGHFDHVMAAFELQAAFGVPFFIHNKDMFLLKRLSKTAEYFLGEPIPALPPKEVSDLSKYKMLTVGKLHFEIIFTPGHTPGSVSLYNKEKKALFVGDVIFASGGRGRTDFSYCSDNDLQKSIDALFKLPEEVTIYCGHGQETTIKDEKRLAYF